MDVLGIVHGRWVQAELAGSIAAPSQETPVPPRFLSFSPLLEAPGSVEASKHLLPHLHLSRVVVLRSYFGHVHRAGDASITAMSEK
mmetsp:Transcript_4384/g.27941  ORF Transcript_4384/g.27941 Transcript_4384/m.27941 type:complete len:86 (+) Transcript_4384:2915-3172(+)